MALFPFFNPGVYLMINNRINPSSRHHGINDLYYVGVVGTINRRFKNWKRRVFLSLDTRLTFLRMTTVIHSVGRYYTDTPSFTVLTHFILYTKFSTFNSGLPFQSSFTSPFHLLLLTLEYVSNAEPTVKEGTLMLRFKSWGLENIYLLLYPPSLFSFLKRL